MSSIPFKTLSLWSLIFWVGFLLLGFFPKTKKFRFVTWAAAEFCTLSFIVLLWIKLERPPLRTLGETRLWYAALLPIFSLLIALKLKKNWMIDLCGLFAAFFLFLNFIHPDNFDKSLAPALQSPWFVPHVMVYMLAYALLASTAVYAFKLLFDRGFLKKFSEKKDFEVALDQIDGFVWVGFAFLTSGLVLGAVWAKEAWGHYWTWDPKETWAFIVWISYLAYIHFRKQSRRPVVSAWFLGLSFIVLLCGWFGVNYMPSAKSSVHTYAIEKP